MYMYVPDSSVVAKASNAREKKERHTTQYTHTHTQMYIYSYEVHARCTQYERYTQYNVRRVAESFSEREESREGVTHTVASN